MARPTKFSQQIADRIVNVLKAGNTRAASALYVGITYTTLKTWTQRNLEFSAALNHAEAEAEIRCVTVLMKAVQDGDVGAAKWWLERRRHEDWRQQDKVDVDLYIRGRARELGLDEEEALQLIKPHLRSLA